MNIDKVTRIEVIDHTWDSRGRVYTFWNKYHDDDIANPKVEVHLQDEDRTLKIFISR